jgi:hypothetical protein
VSILRAEATLAIFVPRRDSIRLRSSAFDELLMLASSLLMGDTGTTRHQLAASVQVLCDQPDVGATG